MDLLLVTLPVHRCSKQYCNGMLSVTASYIAVVLLCTAFTGLHVLQRRPEGKTRWQQAAAVVRSAGNALSSVFTAGLALTTSLLMFIWFSNALTYYGEVLLTTTVRLCPCQHARSCSCRHTKTA